MKRSLTSRGSHTFYFYLGAFAFAGLTPFILLPVLTNHLSPAHFGAVTSFIIWTTLLANIAGLCAHGFVSVRFFKVEANKVKVLVASSIAAVALAHVVATSVLFFFFNNFAQVFDIPIKYLLLGVIASFFVSINLIMLTIFQVTNSAKLYFYDRSFQALVELLLCVLFLHTFFADSGSRIYSYTLAILLSTILALFYMKKIEYIGVKCSYIDSLRLLKFSAPLMPHIVAGTAISNLDRLIVSSSLGAESLGVYMAAMQIGMAMIVLIDPLNKALMPWLFEQLQKNCDDVRRVVVKKTYQLYLVLIFFGVVLYFFANFIFDNIINERYSDARTLIPWFVAGFVMQGMYYTQVNYLFYAERTGRLSLITVLVAIIGVLISWQLTSLYELTGAGASFLINNALMFFLVWYVSSKTVSMPWSLR